MRLEEPEVECSQISLALASSEIAMLPRSFGSRISFSFSPTATAVKPPSASPMTIHLAPSCGSAVRAAGTELMTSVALDGPSRNAFRKLVPNPAEAVATTAYPRFTYIERNGPCPIFLISEGAQDRATPVAPCAHARIGHPPAGGFFAERQSSRL